MQQGRFRHQMHCAYRYGPPRNLVFRAGEYVEKRNEMPAKSSSVPALPAQQENGAPSRQYARGVMSVNQRVWWRLAAEWWSAKVESCRSAAAAQECLLPSHIYHIGPEGHASTMVNVEKI